MIIDLLLLKAIVDAWKWDFGEYWDQWDIYLLVLGLSVAD